MTLTELIAYTRTKLDDTVATKRGNYLWSDGEITIALNIANNEWNEEIRNLRDSSTLAICNIGISDTDYEYDMSDLIIEIISARLNSDGLPIDIRTEAWMDHFCRYDWRSSLADKPLVIIPNYEAGTLRIYPKMNTGKSDVIWLSVARHQLTQFSTASPNDSPEIHFTQHVLLVDGALRELYKKSDSKTFNPKASADAGNDFEEHKSKAKAKKYRQNADSMPFAPDAGAI